jgi:hypothetical protein
MKAIIPYLDKEEAIRSLDNGGRFYNFGTKANDGLINSAELGKLGGMFSDKKQLILFFEMSLLKLNQGDTGSVANLLDERLQKAYSAYKPVYLTPSEAAKKGQIGQNTIVTGIPTLVNSKPEILGFTMFPIISGNVTSFMMIPIIDQYDVYEVRDEQTSDTFLIAHVKGSTKLQKQKMTFGGVIKELNSDQNGKGEARKFLDASYFIERLA